MRPPLLALRRYDSSALLSAPLKLFSTWSHMVGDGLLSASSIGSDICFFSVRSIVRTIFLVSSTRHRSAIAVRSSCSWISASWYDQPVSGRIKAVRKEEQRHSSASDPCTSMRTFRFLRKCRLRSQPRLLDHRRKIVALALEPL